MPALFTNQDAAIAELTDKLAKVTAERDRARDIAVTLEQEVAAVEVIVADMAALAVSEGIRRDNMPQIAENVRYHKAADARSRLAQDVADRLRAALRGGAA